MGTTARYLKIVASGILLLFAVLGGAFAAGSAFEDLPLRWVTLAAVVLLGVVAGLSWLALRRTDTAVSALLVMTGLLAVTTVVDARWDVFDRDVNGPVMVVLLMAAAVPLAMLGLHRATEAGGMLLLLAAFQLVASGIVPAVAAGEVAWQFFLRGSSGVAVLPLLVAGVLLVVAGRTGHDAVSFWPHHGAHGADGHRGAHVAH